MRSFKALAAGKRADAPVNGKPIAEIANNWNACAIPVQIAKKIKR
jgi:hypothetical protein